MDEDDKIATPKELKTCARKRNLLNNSAGTDLGHSMLGEATLSGHNRLRTKVTQTHKLEHHEFPTCYYVTKHRMPLDDSVSMTLDHHKHLMEEHDLNKSQKHRIANCSGNNGEVEKKKAEKLFCTTMKGGLEQCVRLVINKTYTLCGNDWTA